MLITYLFRHTLEFRSHIFKIFFASGGKGALTSLTKNPADVPVIAARLVTLSSAFGINQIKYNFNNG